MDNVEIIERLASLSAFEHKKIHQLVSLLCTRLELDHYNNHHTLRDKFSNAQQYADVQDTLNFMHRTQWL